MRNINYNGSKDKAKSNGTYQRRILKSGFNYDLFLDKSGLGQTDDENTLC